MLALTGGMGSGKSTVLAMLRKKGAFILDADQIVHETWLSNQTILKKVRRKFGPDIFDAHGNLIRRKLGEKIFGSPASVQFLEKLIHPVVRSTMVRELKKNAGDIAICDIPLLFETAQQKNFDGVIVVTASDALRRRRLLKKGFSNPDISKRFQRQMQLRKKVKQADFVVNNNGTQKQTQKQINQLWTLLRSKS